MAEFEVLQVVPPHDRHTENVRSREEPASAGRTLVGNGGPFERYLYVEGLGIGDCSRALCKDGLWVGASEGGEGESVLSSVSSEHKAGEAM